jgi:DinB family protein
MTSAAQSSDTQVTIAVQAAITAWKQQISQFDKVIASLGHDDDLQRVIAPARNRVYYLLGHLVAVHDRVLALLRVGERKYAHLDEEFLVQPDSHAVASVTTVAELRTAWSDINGRLAAAFDKLTPAEWFERHDAVSIEDFAKEPHRNRLAVLLSRTGHLAMHEGQVRLAVPRAK